MQTRRTEKTTIDLKILFFLWQLKEYSKKVLVILSNTTSASPTSKYKEREAEEDWTRIREMGDSAKIYLEEAAVELLDAVTKLDLTSVITAFRW